MTRVVPIGRASAGVAEMADTLRRIADDLEAGKALAVAIAVDFPDEVGTFFGQTSEAKVFSLLGGVTYLQHRILRALEGE